MTKKKPLMCVNHPKAKIFRGRQVKEDYLEHEDGSTADKPTDTDGYWGNWTCEENCEFETWEDVQEGKKCDQT